MKSGRKWWRSETLHMAGVDAVDFSDDPDYIVLLRCLVKWSTPGAILIEYDGEEMWLPRSILRWLDHAVRSSRLVAIEVLERFARKEAII